MELWSNLSFSIVLHEQPQCFKHQKLFYEITNVGNDGLQKLNFLSLSRTFKMLTCFMNLPVVGHAFQSYSITRQSFHRHRLQCMRLVSELLL